MFCGPGSARERNRARATTSFLYGILQTSGEVRPVNGIGLARPRFRSMRPRRFLSPRRCPGDVWRCSGDVCRCFSGRRCSGDVPEMFWRCSGDVLEMFVDVLPRFPCHCGRSYMAAQESHLIHKTILNRTSGHMRVDDRLQGAPMGGDASIHLRGRRVKPSVFAVCGDSSNIPYNGSETVQDSSDRGGETNSGWSPRLRCVAQAMGSRKKEATM